MAQSVEDYIRTHLTHHLNVPFSVAMYGWNATPDPDPNPFPHLRLWRWWPTRRRR